MEVERLALAAAKHSLTGKGDVVIAQISVVIGSAQMSP